MKLEKKLGQSTVVIASALVEDGGSVDNAGSASLLSEAIHVIGCGFEEKTDWGKEVHFGIEILDLSNGVKLSLVWDGGAGWMDVWL